MAFRKPIIIGLVVGGLAALAIGFVKFSVHGRFAAGTSIAGIDLSYKTTEEAHALLQTATENYLNTPVNVTFSQKTITIPPAELGVKIFLKETLDSLKKINARNTSIAELLSPKILFPDDSRLIVEIDSNLFLQKLETNFQLQELAPKSAAFYFEKGPKLAIREGQKGLALDGGQLMRNIKNSARELTGTDLTLNLKEQEPAITAAMLEQQKENIEKSLYHNFTLLDPIYSDDWDLKLADHLDWISFVPQQKLAIPYINKNILTSVGAADFSGDINIRIEIRQDKLDEFVDAKIAKWLDRPAINVKIYKDQEGKAIIEGQGDNGLKIQRQHLKQAIELAVANGIKEVPIPVVSIPPDLDIAPELQELGIKERIGIGHTSYYGSPPNRVHNIKVGSAKFNGKLIAPGETFSFNENLGPVGAGTGYKKELVIKKEGTLPDFGGGVCQVSTTMFRAILFSGLPIVERNQHTYAVSYYSQILGHGLDATIFLGGPDLKFKNDIGGHILIQTYVENDYELYIVFYGTPTGRTVTLEGPYLSNYRQPGPVVYLDSDELPVGETKQVEKEHVGFKALWYRHITDKFGVTASEPIETNYRAIPAKILTGVASVSEQLR